MSFRRHGIRRPPRRRAAVFGGRGTRATGTGVVGTGVVSLLALWALWAPIGGRGAPAGAAGPAGGADPRPSLTLVSQSPFVTPGQPFDVSIGLGGRPLPAGLELRASLYGQLTARSTFFATTQSGVPTGGLLDTAGPAAVTAGASAASLSVSVGPAGSSGPAPTFALPCQPGSCSGVYPVLVTLDHVDGGTAGRLLTYLTYDESDATAPDQAGGPHALRVALVTPFATPPGAPTGAPTRTGRTSPAIERALAGFEGLAGQLTASEVPSTVVLYAASAQLLAAQGGRGGRQALAQLADLSSGTTDQLPTPSYVPVDAGSLAGAGLTGEVQLQFERGGGQLAQLRVHTHGGTFVSPAVAGTSLATALSPLARGQDVSRRSLRVVVPDASLAPDTADPLTFSQPFTLALGGAAVTAAAVDGQLAAHFTAQPGDPVLAANQLLADLSFIHYERPNGSYARGMVVAPPAGWVPNAAFDGALLAGLTDNPVLEPVTLDTYFATVPQRTPDTTGTRRLASGAPGPFTPLAVRRAIGNERLRLSGFASAVVGAPAITTSLNDTLLAAESATLSPARQVAGVSATEALLDRQLSMVQIAGERTITLTARSAPIPVTVLSSAPYTVRALLTLSSDRFSFPQGASRRMVIDRATNPERIEAVARTTGDLPVEATLTTHRFGLVITRAQLTVRSTATSLVGIVLTVLALAVLAAWWGRTWRRGRRQARRAG